MVKETEYNNILEHVKESIILQYGETHSGVTVVRAVDIRTAKVPYADWLVSAVNAPKEKKKSTVVQDEKFQQFYNSYPLNDKFIYKNKSFVPLKKRGLRGDFQKCQQKFLNLVKSTAIPAEVYIKAIQVEVECIKQKSYKTDNNCMSFMPGMEVWLNNKRYYENHLYEEMPAPLLDIKPKVYENSIDQ